MGGAASAINEEVEAKKTLVETSWATVKTLGLETVGVLLFKNIFTIAPEALGLFSFKDEADLYESESLKAHGKNVVTYVGHAVDGLRTPDKLAPILKDLGKTHVKYGVLPAHFDVVGKALMMTLDQGYASAGISDQLTAEVKEAWEQTYAAIAATMIEGMQPEAAPAAEAAAPAEAAAAPAAEAAETVAAPAAEAVAAPAATA